VAGGEARHQAGEGEKGVNPRLEFKEGTVYPPLPGTSERPPVRTWEVHAAGNPNVHVGMVAWVAEWGRVAFFPGAETVLDAAAVREVAEFMEGQR
jgi:hypothetical protein